MAMWVVEFLNEVYKIRKIFASQRILSNFKNWSNGGPHKLAKIRVFKVDDFNLKPSPSSH